MWRATVYAATLAVALVGASTTQVAAQGKGHGKGQASERFEERGKGKGKETASQARTQGRVTARSADDIRREQAERERDRMRRDRDRYDDDRYDDDRYEDGRYDRNVYGQQAKSGSPSFCRSGAGHPTKGRQWCIQKGFGLGNDRWGRARWEDVVFGRPTSGRTTQSGRMSGSVLQDVLGRVIYGRLTNQARTLGGGSLYGNWLNTGDSRILQVQAGSRPLAEFIDQNYDGRADVILLNLGR